MVSLICDRMKGTMQIFAVITAAIILIAAIAFVSLQEDEENGSKPSVPLAEEYMVIVDEPRNEEELTIVAALSALVVHEGYHPMFILEDGWLDNCAKMGAYLKGRLEGFREKYDFIKDVRGLGLIIGVELDRAGAPVVKAFMEKGFLINCAQDNVLRFLPPLIVTKEEIDLLLETLDDVFGHFPEEKG